MPVILTGMSITTADDRVTSYAPVVATTDFAADFPVFDIADISVFVNGLQRFDFTVTANFTDGISTNATVVLSPGVTGAVDVVGSRVPHRSNRFVNGAPLPVPAQNLALDTVEAEVQEAARDLGRAHKAPYGQSGGVFSASDIQNAQSNAAAASTSAEAAAASAAAAAVFDPTNYFTKAGAAKSAIADTDIIGLHDGAFKTFTLANLVSSIFKVGRYIDNARFMAASLRLRNAANVDSILTFLATAARTYTFGDRDMVINPPEELIATIDISSTVASIDIPNLGNYRQIEIEGWITPASATTLLAVVSTDNGATWITTASYIYQALVGTTGSATAANVAGQGAMQLTAANNASNAPSAPTTFKLTLDTFNEARELKGRSEFETTHAGLVGIIGHRFTGTTARNAIRLIAGSGSIAAASLRVKGRR